MTTALLDRLTHQCGIVETGNESWWFRNRAWSLKASRPAWLARPSAYGSGPSEPGTAKHISRGGLL